MDLVKGLKDILSILDEVKTRSIIKDYALIGGFAVSIWGQPRATQDIDFLVSSGEDNDLSKLINALENKGLGVELLKGDLTDPVPLLLHVSLSTARADLIIVTRNWEDEAVKNTVNIEFQDFSIPVVSPEYLIIMKLKAGGPKDIFDVQTILDTAEIKMETVKDLAKRYRVDKKLDNLLRS